jgi:hypothetical protein
MYIYEVQCDKSYRFKAFLFMEKSVTDKSVALILSPNYNIEIKHSAAHISRTCANTVNSTINLYFHN